MAHLTLTMRPEDADTPRFMYSLGVAYGEAGDYASAARYLRDAGLRASTLGQEMLATQIEMALRKVEQRAIR